MGKKKAEESTNVAAAEAKPDEEADVEDTPTVKALKELDDKYCAIEKEFETECEKMKAKFKQEAAGFDAERLKLLSDATAEGAAAQSGTPACERFWLTALQNAEEVGQIIEEHDEPVLEYLEDIKTYDLEPGKSGTKIELYFKENPYFTNKVLSAEMRYDYDHESYKPWQQLRETELRGTAIDWKAGKNVTVEVVEKKVKGGGAKKAKQKAKAAKEEPRISFFRFFFSTLKVGEPVPDTFKPCLEAVAMSMGADPERLDEEEQQDMMRMVMSTIGESIESINEGVAPYAVRFFTGEAHGCGSDSDDDMSEDGEEESDEDGDDSEDDVPVRAKASAKKQGGKKGKSPVMGPKDGEAKQEECKQQ